MKIYFGENLRRLRTENSLTQEKLAAFLGVTYQTISKWENNDSYPDITTLPVIAKFFKISVDDLLGTNQSDYEAEIDEKIKEYDNLADKFLMKDLIYRLKEEYPDDYRVSIRYLSYLSRYSENKNQILPEAVSVYEYIQQNCTDDKTRITAKKALIELYHSLSKNKDNEISFDSYKKLITQMPRMRDCMENFAFFYPETHPERDENIRNTLEEELLLLHHNLESYYFFNDNFDADYKLGLCNAEINFLSFIYDDENFGKLWQVMIHNYGHLAIRYAQKGDFESSLINLRKSAELAVSFDNMERFTTLESKLFQGKIFDKFSLGSTYNAKATVKKRITEKYPLPYELKKTEEFSKIVQILTT